MKQGNSVTRYLPPTGSEANTTPHTWQYVGDTLAIRQSYVSHTQIIRYSIVRHTPKYLCNLQIRFRYVRHTLQARYSCAINTLDTLYTVHLHANVSPAYTQRITDALRKCIHRLPFLASHTQSTLVMRWSYVDDTLLIRYNYAF